MIQTCACQLVCTFHTWRGINIQERSLSLFPHLGGGMHSLRTSAFLSLSRTVSHVLHAWHSCKGSRCHLSSFSRFSSGEGKVKGVWGRVLNRSFHPWISLDSFEWVWDTKTGETFPSVSQSRAQTGNTASRWHLQQLKNSFQRLLTLPRRGISCKADRKQSWNVWTGKFNFDVYMGLNRKGDWGRDHAHPSTGMVSQVESCLRV